MNISIEPIQTKEELEKKLNHMAPNSSLKKTKTKKETVHLYWYKCSKCSVGHIVARESDYGTFGGCSNYPDCHHKIKYKSLVYEILKKEGFKLYAWDTECWKCQEPITLFSYFPNFDNTDLNKVADLDICLGDVDLIDSYLKTKYPSIKSIYSKKKRQPYDGNVCVHCNMLQGQNLKLKEMKKWLESLTPKEREAYVVERIPVTKLISYENFSKLFWYE